jgi:hypothetical protein
MATVLLEAQLFAGLARGQRAAAQQADDFGGALDELAVAGEHALVEVEIVLQPDAHIAAQDRRGRRHRHLGAPDAERKPVRAVGQVVAHQAHGVGVRAEIQRPAIQRADFRPDFLHMGQPLGGIYQIGALGCLGRVVMVGHVIAAHAGGQVDDDVDAAGADALHHLLVQIDPAA